MKTLHYAVFWSFEGVLENARSKFHAHSVSCGAQLGLQHLFYFFLHVLIIFRYPTLGLKQTVIIFLRILN